MSFFKKVINYKKNKTRKGKENLLQKEAQG